MTLPDVTVRPATLTDAPVMAAYVNTLFAEGLDVLYRRDGRVLTDEDERNYIHETGAVRSNLLLVAVRNGEMIGLLDFHAHREPQRAHAGEFGMSVARAHRGSGVGRELLNGLLAWVGTERRVNRVELQVFSNNERAIRLYESLGFAHEGRKARAVRVGNAYVDMLDMARVWPFEPAWP